MATVAFVVFAASTFIEALTSLLIELLPRMEPLPTAASGVGVVSSETAPHPSILWHCLNQIYIHLFYGWDGPGYFAKLLMPFTKVLDPAALAALTWAARNGAIVRGQTITRTLIASIMKEENAANPDKQPQPQPTTTRTSSSTTSTSFSWLFLKVDQSRYPFIGSLLLYFKRLAMFALFLEVPRLVDATSKLLGVLAKYAQL